MLMDRKKKNKISSGFLGLVLTLLLVSQNVHAINTIEVGADVSLKIEYKYDGKNIEGATFDIYKVAEVSEDVKFTKISGFAKFEGMLENLDESEWKQQAKDAADFVKNNDEIEPVSSGKTNVEGLLTFPDEETKMTTGLYLVIGKTFEKNGVTYNSDPFFICLPNLDPTEQWVYEETASPKVTTNTVKDTPKDVPKNSKLPQTGMLLWPVPILAGTGLLFFMIGWAKRQKEER